MIGAFSFGAIIGEAPSLEVIVGRSSGCSLRMGNDLTSLMIVNAIMHQQVLVLDENKTKIVTGYLPGFPLDVAVGKMLPGSGYKISAYERTTTARGLFGEYNE